MIMLLHRSGRKLARDRAEALDRILGHVAAWPGVSTAPHHFDAVEFQIDGTEFGHLHRSGVLSVPFVRRIRNALVDAGMADVHPWVPNSGWVTFEVRSMEDVEHAIRLLRLSYLYRAIAARHSREAEDGLPTPEEVRDELESLRLPSRLLGVYGGLLSRESEEAPQEA